MPERKNLRRGTPRGFWSGTIAFGLVNVPVGLFVATRPPRASLRMVDEDGTPLRRIYFCSREDEALAADDIVRGYEVEKGRFVVVEDEELEEIAPEKSREISLERFVDVASIDPIYFERAYFLAPGRGGARPYRLLARAMEKTGRAGIATFVMRGKEYLVAIIAEDGILRAETMRFPEDVRSPERIGLPALPKTDAARVRRIGKAIAKLAAERLDRDALADRYVSGLEKLVRSRLRSGRNVVQAPDTAEPSEQESAQIIDLMAVLKRSVKRERAGTGKDTDAGRRNRKGRARTGRARGKGPGAAVRHRAAGHRSKSDLYEQARRMDIPGRSNMNRDELIAAIASAD